ncbi:Asp23/Gls24 family envelope stress response protein [Streptomyces sp. SBT349]|uniref:Asp23/Gls24 family envelope stress response protein n=1 Tax=Streptomyces sp. SBT349 TaxID=1580539 RepID=UPI00066EB42A|nr:Asp23/Gls24 family envelope stress response protein [Streptomyces sp. SBT349]
MNTAEAPAPPGGEATVAVGRALPRDPAATRGQTSISGGVVEKIAGLAAREVPGVSALGDALSRTPDAVRGVTVEVGRRQTAVDLEVMVEYGTPLREVAQDVRENVIAAVERMTGLEVVEVNVAVADVLLPGEEPTDQEPRVQ